MSLEAWGLFVLTETVLCLTPGPAVLFVVSHAPSRGVASSVAAASGILTANVLYFPLSATGLAGHPRFEPAARSPLDIGATRA